MITHSLRLISSLVGSLTFDESVWIDLCEGMVGYFCASDYRGCLSYLFWELNECSRHQEVIVYLIVYTTLRPSIHWVSLAWVGSHRRRHVRDDILPIYLLEPHLKTCFLLLNIASVVFISFRTTMNVHDAASGNKAGSLKQQATRPQQNWITEQQIDTWREANSNSTFIPGLEPRSKNAACIIFFLILKRLFNIQDSAAVVFLEHL